MKKILVIGNSKKETFPNFSALIKNRELFNDRATRTWSKFLSKTSVVFVNVTGHSKETMKNRRYQTTFMNCANKTD